MAEITRRTLLNRALLVSALGGGALLGLTRPVRHKVAVPPPAPPVALTAALDRQQRLLAGYELVLADRPARPVALTALRADVAAHGDALRAVLERYPGWRLAQSTPSPAAPSGSTAPPGTVPALASATRTAAAATAKACLAWPAGDANAAQVVPLLGSIAACLSTHLQVLA